MPFWLLSFTLLNFACLMFWNGMRWIPLHLQTAFKYHFMGLCARQRMKVRNFIVDVNVNVYRNWACISIFFHTFSIPLPIIHLRMDWPKIRIRLHLGWSRLCFSRGDDAFFDLSNIFRLQVCVSTHTFFLVFFSFFFHSVQHLLRLFYQVTFFVFTFLCVFLCVSLILNSITCSVGGLISKWKWFFDQALFHLNRCFFFLWNLVACCLVSIRGGKAHFKKTSNERKKWNGHLRGNEKKNEKTIRTQGVPMAAYCR